LIWICIGASFVRVLPSPHNDQCPVGNGRKLG
jgi:hypothetical protein